MESSKGFEAGTVEWRPDWEGEDRHYYEEVRRRALPSVSLLRRFRETMNLSQVEAAKILATSQSNVSKLEAKADPAISVLARLAEARGAKVRIVLDLDEGVVEFTL